MPEPEPDHRSLQEGRTATRSAGFVAGVAGAAVALGVGELIEGVSETIPSLVIAVGEVVTDYTPGEVVAFSITNLGASQKTVLTVGIVVLSLAICGLLGRFAASGRRSIAIGGFALFGLIGGWAAARNPLSPAVQSWIVALAAAAIGTATTLFLVSRAAAALRRAVEGASDFEGAEEGDGGSRQRVGTRRSFFAYAGGAAVTALGLVGLGRSLRGESAAEKARAIYTLPPRTPDPASDAAGGTTTGDASVAIEVPEGIAIEDEVVIEVPEGIEIPEDPVIEVPEGIEIPEDTAIEVLPEEAGASSTATSTPSSEQADPTSTAELSVDDAAREVTSTSTTQPEEPAPTTSTTQPEEPAPTTSTTQPEEPAPTTSTTQPEEPAPTTSTTQPEEPAPTTSTTQPEEPAPTTTQQPPQSSTLPQVAHLDTLDDEVPGISPFITPISPKDEFYRIDTALTVPQVDPDNWRLRITGLVDNPYELTYHDIRAMRLSDYVITLSCVSNRVGGNLVDNAVWTGVPLNVLLQRAGVQRGAQQIVGRSVDDFTAGFPTTAAYDGRNAILAIGMNNEPLPTRHGFPARIVVAGLYGYVSAVKWLEEIHLTTWDGFDGYWVPRGWSKRGPIKTQSRIDVPGMNADLKIGQTTSVAGIAWAPTRGIRRVEVKIGRENWESCRLGEAVGDESWVQWHREWTPATAGHHDIQVRATDGTGTTQGSYRIPSKPNGAEGHHTITVNVRR